MPVFLKKPTETEFELIFQDMKKQFPYMDFSDKTAFLQTLTRKDFGVWLAQKQEGDQLQNTGYMMLWLDTKNNQAWLLFIAVFSHLQNSGAGSAMLQKIKDLYPQTPGIFLELEKPNPTDLNSMRRISFYTKKGAYPLRFRFFVPQPRTMIPMDLYYLPLKKETPEPSSELVKDSIKNYFYTVYGNSPFVDRAFSQTVPL